MIKHLIYIIIGTGIILSIPLIAMGLSDKVNWSVSDFIVSGILLIGSGLLYETITTPLEKKYRPFIAIIILITVLLVWEELAVGIFDSPFAGS